MPAPTHRIIQSSGLQTTIHETNFAYIFLRLLFLTKEPGSSISIVSGYGLDDQAIQIRSPAEAKDFSSSLCVQTGSGAHPASYAMSIGFLPRG
jgi:hypothetical protein